MIKTKIGKVGAAFATAAVALTFAGSALALSADALLLLQVLKGAGVISQAQFDQYAGMSATSGSTGSTSGYNFAKDLSSGSTGDDVKALQNLLGISPATGYFGPKTFAAVVAFQKAHGLPQVGRVGPATRGVLNSMGGTSSTGGTVVTGGVSVSAGAVTSGAVIAGQAAASLAEYRFSNGTGFPVMVTSVTLQKGGVFADEDLQDVFLYQGAVRLTDSASVASGQITFNAGSGLFTIPANSSVVINVRANIPTGANPGAVISLSLTGASVQGTSIASSYPIMGGNYTVASISNLISATSTVDASIASSSNPVQLTVGTTNQTIFRTTLDISGSSWVKGFAVKVYGSAPMGSLNNFKLYVGGVQVATSYGPDVNGMLTFDLMANPYKLDGGAQVEVRADVIKGSSRTVNVQLVNGADVLLYDNNYNVAVKVASVGGNTAYFVVNATTGGSVIASLASDSPSADVITGSTNIILAKYKLKAFGEDIKISKLTIQSTKPLQGIALFINGTQQYGSTKNITATSSDTEFTSTYVLPVGQEVSLEVRGNIKNPDGTNAATSTSAKITLIMGSANGEGRESFVTSNVPVQSYDGYLRNIVAASATLNPNNQTGTLTYSPNPTGNILLGSYVIKAGSSDGLSVKTLTVKLNNAQAGATTNVSNLSVKSGTYSSTVIGQPSASNVFNVDFTVAAGASRVVEIYGSLGAATGTASTSLSGIAYGVNTPTLQITLAEIAGQSVAVGNGTVSSIAGVTDVVSTPAQQLVVAGTNGKVLTFKVLASNAPVTVTSLTFAVVGGVDQITVGGQAPVDVNGSTVTVDGLNISVPIGNIGTSLPVSVKYSQVGFGSSHYGDSPLTTSVELTDYKYKSGSANEISATTSIFSNDQIVVGSKLKLEVLTSSSAIGSGRTIAKVKASVDSTQSGTVVFLKTLPISITKSSNAQLTSSTTIREVGGTTITGTTITLGPVTSTSTTASGTITFSGDGYPITTTAPVTFEIVADTAAADSNTGYIYTGLGASNLLNWTDIVGNAPSLDGTNMVPYPTERGSVVF